MKRIISMFVIVLLLAACVPTPETEFVTHKDTEEMLEKAAATPVSDVVGYSGGADANGELPEAPHIRERYAIPETLSETVTEADGHFTVNIDARVEVPDVVDIPIIRVEKATFTQDEITRLFNALTKGRPLYHNGNQMTKSDIAALIARLENELNDPNSNLGPDDKELLEEHIQSNKERWQTAPDTIDGDVCDGTIGVMPYEENGETYTRYGFQAFSRDSLPQMYCQAEIPSSERFDACFFWFFDQRSLLSGSDGDIKIRIKDPQNPVELAEYPNVTYTPAQAMADTETFFRDNGFPFVKADTVTFFPSKDGSQYGYQVRCVRESEGVLGTNPGASTGGHGPDGYTPAWMYERIEVCIDAEGIYSFSWHAPLKETEIVLPATNLMPFDTITQTMRQRLWLEKQPWLMLNGSMINEEDYPSDLRIEITRVTLTLQRVMEKNKFDSGLLVPVWNFWGTITETRVNKKTRATYEDFSDDRYPRISINAIDGSVIDWHLGY
ncbi:MAG: membrane lipoprotein lipid attachment site-containing protein [Clostridia bacterium]|nr:membrane lipoprotein lipid attachment site-containing protein [Clostridia bacterium]